MAGSLQTAPLAAVPGVPAAQCVTTSTLVTWSQQEFSPARKFPRNDPYDNQIGEAEYADRPMALDEFELKTELLKAEEL